MESFELACMAGSSSSGEGEDGGRDASGEADAARISRSAETRRVLVVDDNPDAADSLAMLLRMLGAEVLVAYDGAQALGREAESFQPTLVLLDLGMPKPDGLEVARRLRERTPDGGPVLIALTGWDQHEDRQRTHDAGFDHHLVKPVSLDTLESLLAKLDR